MSDGRYRRRACQGHADLRAIQTLAQRLWTGGPGRWHIGELADRPIVPGAATLAALALWEHEGRVVAWARRGDGSSAGHPLRLQIDPAHVELTDELLDWAAESPLPAAATAAGTARAGGAVLAVADSEGELLARLRAAGYRETTGGSPVLHLRRTLTDLPTPQTPEGHWLRHVRGDADAGVRATVGAWAGEDPAVAREEWLRSTRRWPYRPELDWLAGLTTCGAGVAARLAWLDDVNRSAALEPVQVTGGVTQAWLVRATTLAALHAARRYGAVVSTTRVTEDSEAHALHRSLGFTTEARELTMARQG
ncbi:hypothetical protein [Streptomyces spiramenti]|uniref:GNAT family N-acetyltransferase n=1 Tax=Streptomyces spiramenti TaxID=2720606 RepID=A0ABX1ARL6_9ACTN|nr:hypothetical protein [Streptomyces spiramenti]NJP66905.1 hypothetical protein [Streptomyces spiramenti]